MTIKRRIHSRELKLEVRRRITQGEKRPMQVCREHEVSPRLLQRCRLLERARSKSARSGCGSSRSVAGSVVGWMPFAPTSPTVTPACAICRLGLRFGPGLHHPLETLQVLLHVLRPITMW